MFNISNTNKQNQNNPKNNLFGNNTPNKININQNINKNNLSQNYKANNFKQNNNQFYIKETNINIIIKNKIEIINDREEEEDEKEEEINDNEIISQKCSSDEHKEENAIYYCQKCNISMCNKCEKFHSALFKNHLLYSLDKDIKEIFTGLCPKRNHSLNLDFFAKLIMNYVALLVFPK